MWRKLIETEWRICALVGQANIGSDYGLSANRHRAIIWTNAIFLLIEPLETKWIRLFSFKTYLEMSYAKRRPFCLVLNVLKSISIFSGKNRECKDEEIFSAIPALPMVFV